jgi:GTP-binding protein HflX
VSDTVGFVRDLPHELVEAFASTLEEVADADLLIHLVDASDPDPDQQIAAVRTVLGEIDADGVEELIVYNKIDAADPTAVTRLRALTPEANFISAQTGEGIDLLLNDIVDGLHRLTIEMQLVVPYSRGDVLAELHVAGDVLKQDHTDSGTDVTVRLPNEEAHRFRAFVA